MDNQTIEYAKTMLGIPYKWGGNNPLTGLDCSGFVLEVLRSCGKWGPTDDTAQGIFNLCTNATVLPTTQGTLLFFGKDAQHITHIAIALDSYRMIEAGGGGSKTLTRKDAEDQGAFVRIRAISNRKDLVARGVL